MILSFTSYHEPGATNFSLNAPGYPKLARSDYEDPKEAATQPKMGERSGAAAKRISADVWLFHS